MKTTKIPEEARDLISWINRHEPRESLENQGVSLVTEYCLTCERLRAFKYIGENYGHPFYECSVCGEIMNKGVGKA